TQEPLTDIRLLRWLSRRNRFHELTHVRQIRLKRYSEGPPSSDASTYRQRDLPVQIAQEMEGVATGMANVDDADWSLEIRDLVEGGILGRVSAPGIRRARFGVLDLMLEEIIQHPSNYG